MLFYFIVVCICVCECTYMSVHMPIDYRNRFWVRSHRAGVTYICDLSDVGAGVSASVLG